MDKQDNRMNRRDFLKIVGISTAGTAVALSGCSPKESTETAAEGPVPTGKMTYRNFPPSKDQVSILGYGCMRWPTLPAPEKGGNVIDQEQVNRLIDYAIEHGVHRPETPSERKIPRCHQNVELRPFGFRIERADVSRLDEEAASGLHRLLPAPFVRKHRQAEFPDPFYRQRTARLSGKGT